MAQITWKNVDGPDSAASLKAIGDAGRSISSGFDKLANLGNSIRQTNINNANQEKAANTEKALSVINSIGSPEEFEQAQASGMFNQENVTNQFGNVDDKAIRLAFGNRQGEIRNEVKAKAIFGDFQNTQNEKADVARIKTLIAQGDPTASTELDSADIEDKSNLASLLKVANRSSEVERRQDEVYTRNQDKLSDSDAYNAELNRKTATRTANIAASRQIQDEFINTMKENGVPDGTFIIDQSGNMRFSETATPQMQEVIKSEYALIKPNLPTILSDKEQVAELREYGATLNADPSLVESMVTSLKNIQQERKTLSPEGTALVEQATQTADRNYAQIVDAEEAVMAQVRRDNPINQIVTAQQEAIKPSEGITNAIEYVRDSIYDGDMDDSDVNKFGRLLTEKLERGYTDLAGSKTGYPGWVIDEAVKIAQPKIGSNALGVFMNERNSNIVMEEVDKIMQKHQSSKRNQEVLNAISADSKARLFAAEGARQKVINNAITNAKSKSGIYNIRNNSAQALQNAFGRNQ